MAEFFNTGGFFEMFPSQVVSARITSEGFLKA